MEINVITLQTSQSSPATLAPPTPPPAHHASATTTPTTVGSGERNVAAAWTILHTPERVKGNDLTALEAYLNDELGILAAEDLLEMEREYLLRIKDFLKPAGANLFAKALNL